MLSDLRTALRSIKKSKATTVVILLTLALGLGANIAIFSVVNGVLLQPLRYREPERLVLLTSQFPTLGFDRFWVSPPEYHELREWSQSYESLGAYVIGQVSLVGGEAPMRVTAGYVTSTLFDTLGVPPRRGRVYDAEEDLPNAAPVAVLSSELWESGFGGDPSLIGSTLEVDGQPTTVLGVMPKGFDVEEGGAQLWLPINLDPLDHVNRRGNHLLYLVGRLATGVDIAAARVELETLLADWRERIGEGHVPNPESHRFQIEPLHEDLVGETRPALLALLGAVGFVLLIACANVASVMLARSEARQRELAIRNSLGASRWSLVRLVLTESLLLSFLGGGLGVLAGTWGLRVLLRLSPGSLPRTDEVALDGTVLAFALAATVAAGLLSGLFPALSLRLGGVPALLKEGAKRSTSGVAGLAFRRGLVVLEMALAVGLVVGAGLMIRSLDHLLGQDAGIERDSLSTFELYLPRASYPDPSAQVAFFDRLFEEIGELPGVLSVGAANGLPPARRVDANDTFFENHDPGEDGPPNNADYWQFATRGYLQTMGIRIVDGRGFGPSDDPESTAVCLVNERIAGLYYPGRSALGNRISPPTGSDRVWFNVVGVVEDVKQGGLASEVGTEVYWSYEQIGLKLGFAPRTMNVVVRSNGDPTALFPRLREAVWSLDRSLPVANLRTMNEVFTASVMRSRFLTLLIGIFGGMALLLAAIGIYGVMSYSVEQRGHEMGIRMALGADRGSILGDVLRQGGLLAVLGVGLGVGLALLLSRGLRSLLYGVSTSDPATYVVVVALLAVTALVACAVPALRATRVSPLRVLRYE